MLHPIPERITDVPVARGARRDQVAAVIARDSDAQGVVDLGGLPRAHPLHPHPAPTPVGTAVLLQHLSSDASPLAGAATAPACRHHATPSPRL